MRFRRLAFALLGSLLVPSCILEPLVVREECPSLRAAADGSCCPAWSQAVDGECVVRAWTSPQALGADSEKAHGAVVAVDGLGRVHLAWAHQTEVLHAIDKEGQIELYKGPALLGQARELDLAAGPEGESVVVFRQGGFLGAADTDGAIFAMRQTASGMLLDASEPLSPGIDAYQPRAVIGAKGTTFITWNQWTGANYGVAHASLAKVDSPIQAFTSVDDVLSQPIFFSNAPRPAMASDGSLVVTWYQSVAGPLLAFVSERSGAEGALSRPTPEQHLSSAEAPLSAIQPTFNPTAAIHDDGRAAVFWTQEDNEGHIAVYLARRSADGVWAKPSSLQDSLGPRTGTACCGQVAISPDGPLAAVWEQDGEIRLSLENADGSFVTTPGEGQVLSSPGALALDTFVVYGPSGAGLITYREEIDGVFQAVAHRIVGSEVGPAQVLSSATEDVNEPRAAVGGSNDDAAVVWREGGNDGTGGAIHYVRLTR